MTPVAQRATAAYPMYRRTVHNSDAVNSPRCHLFENANGDDLQPAGPIAFPVSSCDDNLQIPSEIPNNFTTLTSVPPMSQTEDALKKNGC